MWDNMKTLLSSCACNFLFRSKDRVTNKSGLKNSPFLFQTFWEREREREMVLKLQPETFSYCIEFSKSFLSTFWYLSSCKQSIELFIQEQKPRTISMGRVMDSYFLALTAIVTVTLSLSSSER